MAIAFAESSHTLGKDIVADNHSADRLLPRATLGKDFVEGEGIFLPSVLDPRQRT